MPSTRKSLRQVIVDLEQRGSISKQDADSLRIAPQWSLSGAEITGYLGGGIVTVGITWIIVAAAQDLNRQIVTFLLYATGAVALATARWLRSRGVRSGQVAEVLFGIGIGTMVGAIGTTLNNLGVRDSVAVAVASALAVSVGLATCRRTSFAGMLLVVVAAQPLIGSISETFHLSENTFPLLIDLSGGLLVVLGIQRVPSALVARIAGSTSIVVGSLIFAVTGESIVRPVISLVVSSALFYFGARRINLEFIVGGGAGITIAIGVISGRIFDSSSVQGVVITATGAAISALSLFIVRHNESGST